MAALEPPAEEVAPAAKPEPLAVVAAEPPIEEPAETEEAAEEAKAETPDAAEVPDTTGIPETAEVRAAPAGISVADEPPATKAASDDKPDRDPNASGPGSRNRRRHGSSRKK